MARDGVSKAFGEAAGSLYASKHGMRVTSIRIASASAESAAGIIYEKSESQTWGFAF
jgi:hypothetical protein